MSSKGCVEQAVGRNFFNHQRRLDLETTARVFGPLPQQSAARSGLLRIRVGYYNRKRRQFQQSTTSEPIEFTKQMLIPSSALMPEKAFSKSQYSVELQSFTHYPTKSLALWPLVDFN